MRNIKLLDCTLRDGGCVNNFDFGNFYMDQILHGIEQSGIEVIELGYIDEQKGTESGRTQFCNEQVITRNFLKHKQNGISYVAMIDYGKYDPRNLCPRTESSIDGIRLAFHKENRFDMISYAKTILQKGYDLYIQPMTCLRYSDVELIEFINKVNSDLPETTAFYIVDSFGEMRLNDLNRIVNLVDYNLKKSITIGFHSHNNLQLSYSNAVSLLDFPTKRDLIFDSSIMGMGKGAGNMTTELFAEHLNLYEDKKYCIEPLLEVIDKVINQIREKYSWGYSIEYYLSAAKHCTPSYAGHYYRKHMLSVNQVSDLLEMISEEKRNSFDKEYADALYYEYNTKNYDDTASIQILKKKISDKKVLLIAPGKSVIDYVQKIEKVATDNNVVTIALNNMPPIDVDYIFVSKKLVLEYVDKEKCNLILSSNIASGSAHALTINYALWTDWAGRKSDNALIMILNILMHIGIKDVYMAGFDGFKPDVDENYYDERLKRPVDKVEAERRNQEIKSYLGKCRENNIEIHFITKSLYDEKEGLV